VEVRMFRALACVSLLAASSGCLELEGPSEGLPVKVPPLGSGGDDGGTPTDPADVTGVGPAGVLGPDRNGPELLVCETEAFSVGARGHRMASATFALSAVASGAWPLRVDSSLFDRQELRHYFSRRATDAVPGAVAYGRLVGPPQKAVLEAVIEPEGNALGLQPLHLVLVVDASTSMRNDFGLAKQTVRDMAEALEQGHPSDTISILEWGANQDSFRRLAAPAQDAVELADNFGMRLDDIDDGQLSPGGSLAPAAQIVTQAIQASTLGAHVVVLTDGGIVVDAATMDTVRGWTDLNALVSFVEVQGEQGESHEQSGTFHVDVLRSLGAAGGGVTLYLSSALAPAMITKLRFDELFRPSIPALEVTFETSSLSPTELSGASDDVPRLGWAATGRPVFVSLPVTYCDDDGEPPASIVVAPLFDGDAARTILLGGALPNPQVRRLEIVDLLTSVLVAGCGAQQEQLDELLLEVDGIEPGVGYAEIKELVVSMQLRLAADCSE